MSLTGMLEIKDSRLRLWWDQELPSIKSHTRAGLWKLPLAAPPPLSAKREAGLVGTAVDYRMRWLWPCGPARELIGVAYGARMELGDDRARLLAAEVDAVAGPLAGTHSWDDPTSDQRLARLSLVTARLEAAFRSQMPMDPVTSGIRAELSLEEMMAAQRADLVDDVTAIVAASREHLEPLAVRSAILNPVFAHSGLVGGADADVIVDGCLIDFKTTIRPSLASNELRQLVCPRSRCTVSGTRGRRSPSRWTSTRASFRNDSDIRTSPLRCRPIRTCSRSCTTPPRQPSPHCSCPTVKPDASSESTYNRSPTAPDVDHPHTRRSGTHLCIGETRGMGRSH